MHLTQYDGIRMKPAASCCMVGGIFGHREKEKGFVFRSQAHLIFSHTTQQCPLNWTIPLSLDLSLTLRQRRPQSFSVWQQISSRGTTQSGIASLRQLQGVQ